MTTGAHSLDVSVARCAYILYDFYVSANSKGPVSSGWIAWFASISRLLLSFLIWCSCLWLYDDQFWGSAYMPSKLEVCLHKFAPEMVSTRLPVCGSTTPYLTRPACCRGRRTHVTYSGVPLANNPKGPRDNLGDGIKRYIRFVQSACTSDYSLIYGTVSSFNAYSFDVHLRCMEKWRWGWLSDQTLWTKLINLIQNITSDLDIRGRAVRQKFCTLACFECKFLSTPSLHGKSGTQVVHQVVLEVNEEGTVAAAISAACVAMCYSPALHKMVVNRPFLLLVKDLQSSLVLFLGKIEKPMFTN